MQAIRKRTKPVTKRPRQQAVDLANTTVIENVAQTKRLTDSSRNQGSPGQPQRERLVTPGVTDRLTLPDIEEDRPTNNTSNSQVSSLCMLLIEVLFYKTLQACMSELISNIGYL